MKDRHYILRGRSGIYSRPGDADTVIGQCPGCDIRLDNRSRYVDVDFARISPDHDGHGWHIVRLSGYFPIQVNGTPLNRVHYLGDGDVIDFGAGNIFRFRTAEGAVEKPEVTHVHGQGRLLWVLAAAVAVIGLIVGLQFWSSGRDEITARMRADIEGSLFTTRVDRLTLVAGDSILDEYIYASGGPVGTAFLTADSLLVTARHCLQPWLNMVEPQEYGRIPESEEWPVAAALRVETANQLAGGDVCRLVSHITLTAADGTQTGITSDAFVIDYTGDEIVELGGFDNPLYWRSISHRYTRSDMMLGDIAVARFGYAGKIEAAGSDDIVRLLGAADRTVLTFAGFPEAGVTGNTLDYATDRLRVPLTTVEGDSTRLFMLAHQGGLSPGFSGGPVLTRDGSGFKAVGVISVIDDRNGNRAYSVPLSEIDRLKKSCISE